MRSYDAGQGAEEVRDVVRDVGTCWRRHVVQVGQRRVIMLGFRRFLGRSRGPGLRGRGVGTKGGGGTTATPTPPEDCIRAGIVDRDNVNGMLRSWFISNEGLGG